MISLLHIYCVYIDTQRYIYFRRVLFNLGYVNGVRGIVRKETFVRSRACAVSTQSASIIIIIKLDKSKKEKAYQVSVYMFNSISCLINMKTGKYYQHIFDCQGYPIILRFYYSFRFYLFQFYDKT